VIIIGLYIGDVWIPFVENFDIDDGERTIQVIKHIDKATPPHFAEFANPILTATLNGTVIQNSASIKTASNYAEDVLALLNRTASDNYVNLFQGRSGWVSVRSANVPINASTPLSRDYTIVGNFLPNTIYQASMKTYPVIMSNPWSFVLGSDDCDNYIAVPIGATYTGGDGSTMTAVGEDGTITSVLATTDQTLRFDIAEDDVDNGEVKIYDDMDGVEATWVRVFNPKHVFTGSIVIENSLYRLIFNNTDDEFALYVWFSSVYNKLDDFTCGAFDIIRFMEVGPDKVKIKVNSTSTLTLERGKPMKIDTTTETLSAVSIDVYTNTTSIDNYIALSNNIYVASNTNFSTDFATKSLGVGVKWLYWETVGATAIKIAHRALVDRRYRREIVER